MDCSESPPQSIAVLRLGALGDICMTVPLVTALKRYFPAATIYWIIGKNMASLVRGLEGIELIEVDKPKGIKGYYQCYQQLKPYRFDVLLATQASLRSNLVCALIKAKIKYGYGRLHQRDGQRLFVNKTVPANAEHLVDSFMQFAYALGVPPHELEWDLPVTRQDDDFARQSLEGMKRPIILVSPVASKEERNWCNQRYINVCRSLIDRWDCSIVIVGDTSPVSLQSANNIAKGLGEHCLNLAGKSHLKQLVAIIRQGDLLIAPDTGPAHIASAVNVPVVGLYAVAPPEKTGPYRSIDLTVNRFPEAVKTYLKKDINQISWRQRVHDHRAMLLIQEEDVIQRCHEVLEIRHKKS